MPRNVLSFHLNETFESYAMFSLHYTELTDELADPEGSVRKNWSGFSANPSLMLHRFSDAIVTDTGHGTRAHTAFWYKLQSTNRPFLTHELRGLDWIPEDLEGAYILVEWDLLNGPRLLSTADIDDYRQDMLIRTLRPFDDTLLMLIPEDEAVSYGIERNCVFSNSSLGGA